MKLRSPHPRLIPAVSKARLSAVGLSQNALVGASASVISVTANFCCPTCFHSAPSSWSTRSCIEMRQQGRQSSDNLRGVEADERIGAEDRVERGMAFLGGLNFRLPFGRTVHFATSNFRSRRVPITKVQDAIPPQSDPETKPKMCRRIQIGRA